MTDRTRNIIVGITSMAGVVGVAFLLLLFGYIPQMLVPAYEVKVELAQAGGLNTSSRVRLDGVDIGSVDQITLQSPPKRGVELTLRIRGEYRLPRQARCAVEAPLLGGGAVLAFARQHLSDEQILDFAPNDGSARYVGSASNMMADVAGGITGVVQSAVSDFRADLKAPLAAVTRLEEDFRALSDTWTQVGRNVTELTEDRDPADVETGKAAANLTTLVRRADARLTELRTVIKSAHDLIGDEKMRDDVKQSIASARAATSDFAATAVQTREAATKVNARIDDITGRLVAVADDLGKAVRSVQATVDQAREGQGTVGKLLRDPAVYDNLNDTIQRLGLAIDDIRLLVQKWRDEGLSVKF